VVFCIELLGKTILYKATLLIILNDFLFNFFFFGALVVGEAPPIFIVAVVRGRTRKFIFDKQMTGEKSLSQVR
jgi:hypothetical protein